MLISLNWLKQYVDIPDDLDPNDLADKLSLSTMEIEGVTKQGEVLDKVVVGKVLKIEQHPNADKLKVAKVDVGKEYLQIVCGGTNLRENMLVPVALVGAKVKWHGEDKLTELAQTKIRGVESFGMICAAEELDLSAFFPPQKETEILDLTDNNFNIGQKLSEALGVNDVVFEIDNKTITNRPDLWGHYGVAREVAAILGEKLKPYHTSTLEQIRDSAKVKLVNLKVEVENTSLCSRYLGAVIDDVAITDSPEWLRKRLESVGVKSINNIVDITNYVMLELGQPLHAFDATKIKTSKEGMTKIYVRNTREEEKITTLDGQERLLIPDDLVIADIEKPIAVAGVMGGANSEISEATRTIILEAANFDATTVRLTSERLGSRTEASMRFEKSLDPNIAETGMLIALALIKETNKQAKIVSKIVDEKDFSLDLGPIEITQDFINTKIGKQLEPKKVEDILTSLGFEVKKVKENYAVTVPTWRATKDITIKEDLVEEITRIYGYNNIELKKPMVVLGTPDINYERQLEREMKQVLNGLGLTEVYNYSFVGEELLTMMGNNISNYNKLKNYLSEEHSMMRKSLLPSLVKNLQHNLKHFDNVKIFELGRVFHTQLGKYKQDQEGKNFLPKQDKYLSGIFSIDKKVDYFREIKGIVTALLQKFQFSFQVTEPKEVLPWMHDNRSAEIVIDDEIVGRICELHPRIIKNFDLRQKAAAFEFDFSKLFELYTEKTVYQPLVKYPSLDLDLSIVVEEKVLWKDIIEVVNKEGKEFIKNIKLFDIYKGDKIPVGKKSLAFTIFYQSKEKTLKMEEVNKIQDKIVFQLGKKLGAVIRK